MLTRSKTRVNDILLDLPWDVVGSIIRTWTDIQTIAALDCAYCNKAKRLIFLAFLASEHYSIIPIVSFKNPEFGLIQWVSKRNVAIDSLHFPDDVNLTLINYFKSVGHRVLEIMIEGDDEDYYGNDTDESLRASNNVASVLEYFANLRAVEFHDCWISSKSILAISQCRSLREVIISTYDDELTGGEEAFDMNVLNSVKEDQLQLISLRIYSCGSEFETLLKMVNPSALTSLLCNRYAFRDNFDMLCSKVARCTVLQALHVRGVNESQLSALLAACPQIHYLSFTGPDCATFLAHTLSRLRAIQLMSSSCCDATLLELAEHRQDTLEQVDILAYREGYDLHQASGRGLNAVLQRCPRMKSLRLTKFDDIDFDVSLLSNLTTLILCYERDSYTNIHLRVDLYLQKIAPYCKKLEYLGIAGCDIPDKVLVLLCKLKLPALRHLHLHNEHSQEGDGRELDLTKLRAKRPGVVVKYNHRLVEQNLHVLAQGLRNLFLAPQ